MGKAVGWAKSLTFHPSPAWASVGGGCQKPESPWFLLTPPIPFPARSRRPVSFVTPARCSQRSASTGAWALQTQEFSSAKLAERDRKLSSTPQQF